MDDIEGNGWHPQNPQRILVKNIPVPHNVVSDYDDDNDDDDEDEDEEEQDIDEQQEEENDNDDADADNNNGENGVERIISYADYSSGDGDNDEEDYDDGQKHPKKRKVTSLLSRYEFAPRVRALPVVVEPPRRPATGGRNSLTDWTEHETFALLNAWGDKFLQCGRKSLRLEEWQEVAEKVSQESRVERSDTQCRNRLDTLKKKYKKEKMRIKEDRNITSSWVYFQKLDMLLSTPAHQAGLSCERDSGEYLFMTPKVHLNQANGWDETRDSPGMIPREGKKCDSEGLPPKKVRNTIGRSRGATLTLLADSIHKFADVYEKTENNKRKQMQELEIMRMNFLRELELQKRHILESAQAKIAIIHQGHDEQNDASAENVSS